MNTLPVPKAPLPLAGATAVPLPASPSVLRKSFTLRNPLGLHCRAAVLIVKALQRFSCNMTFEHGGWTADARSIVHLLGLAAGPGARIEVTASGPDRALALEAVGALFASNFADAYTGDPGFCRESVAA
jgi:phosphotransferase system HPr (HPr) family protein